MWTVYLSGEIHTDWRKQIIQQCATMSLPIEFCSACTDHDASDAAGDHLVATEHAFWRDYQSARINAMRIQGLIQRSDFAVIRFGSQYKQWNAAFDAGYCAALSTPYITLHGADLVHPLKEVDAAAMGWASSVEEVVKTLAHVCSGPRMT
jgi:YtoQ family protein